MEELRVIIGTFNIKNMSRKKTYILIASILLIILLVLIGLYLTGKNPDGSPKMPSVFKDFFPFGGSTVTENIPVEEPTEEPPVVTTDDFTKRLRKITSEQVAGAGVLDVKAGSVIRYIEKATGHIYEVELFSPRAGRISNTTIPMVYDAYWGNKNESLVSQYLKDDDVTVDTYSITLKNISTTTENTISGSAMSKNISSVSAFGNSVFYIEEGSNESIGYVSTFDGKNKKRIWNSPIKELLSQYVNDKTVALATKPHENAPGYLYIVGTNTGTTKKVLSDIYGLSALVNPAGTDVLYLGQSGSALMNLYNIKTMARESISPATFPEKCVWGKKDTKFIYCAVPKDFIAVGTLTSWYRGTISLNDDIWRYDLEDKTSKIIADLSQESGEEIDLMKPTLSDSDQYLMFVNKKDNSLWSLDLTK
jgi:hypothetical protein